MENKIKISILAAVAVFAFGSFGATASAVQTVEFENSPLFSEANFMPGVSVSRWIKINNTTANSHQAIIKAINASDSEGLGDVVNLKIKNGSDVLYDGSFSDFFSLSQLNLLEIGAGEGKTFDLVVTFNPAAGNEYQGSEVSFNLETGLQDVETTTDTTTTISGEIGGSGSGGTSGSKHLIIFNENAINLLANGVIPGSGNATIVWETNIPATSQVIYGLASGSPYPFDINNLPNFGYPKASVEDSNHVINHSVLLLGLTPGETYVYRVVSKASPATISYEHQFTLPIPTGFENISTNGSVSGLGPNGEGEILGANSENNSDRSENEMGDILNKANLASAVVSGWENILNQCPLLALIILVIIYLVWRLFLKNKIRLSAFFALTSALLLVIFYLMGQFCILKIFLIAVIISACFYFYKKYTE